MKKQYVKSISICCAAAMLLSLYSCGDDKKILESTKEEKTAVMTVGDYEVPMEIYRYAALNTKADFESGIGSEIWLGESGSQLVEELNEQIEKTIIRMYTTILICDDYDIKIDDSYVKDALDIRMDEIYESYDYDYELYDSDISKYYMNDSVYRFIMRNDILAEELIVEMMNRNVISSSDEDLEAILASPEFVRVKQILIPSDNGNTDEENYKKAEEILNLVNKGEDFDALIKEYGGDLFLFNNDDGYYISRGNYYKAFEDTAFSLEVGETSDIIKTEAGYSIIKRYPKDADYLAKNFDELSDDYIRGQYNIILENYESGITAETTDGMQNYSVFNLTMDEK